MKNPHGTSWETLLMQRTDLPSESLHSYCANLDVLADMQYTDGWNDAERAHLHFWNMFMEDIGYNLRTALSMVRVLNDYHFKHSAESLKKNTKLEQYELHRTYEDSASMLMVAIDALYKANEAWDKAGDTTLQQLQEAENAEAT